MTGGMVFDVRRFCLHDGRGLRTTVFFKGCPLRCPWCHNPEGLSPEPRLYRRADRCVGCGECRGVCPNGAIDDDSLCRACGSCAGVCPHNAREIVGRSVSASGLVSSLVRDEAYFAESGGGVTFSGGEPFAQADFLLACLKACAHAGISAAVDTSGYAEEGEVRAVAAWKPHFLYDLKHMDSVEHRKRTGKGNEKILGNLRLLASLRADVTISFPLVPGMNDSPENIQETAGFVASLGRNYPVRILRYHAMAKSKYARFGKPYPAEDVREPSEDDAELAARGFRAWGIQTTVGGSL